MTDLYYTVQWQMIEERVNGAVTTQNVFSPVYIDAMILGDRDASAAGNKPGLDQRHYAHYDANFNVTSISRNTTPAPTTAVPNPTPSWGVVERYLYDPYGQAFVLSNTWSSQNASTNAWQYLHQGLRWEGSVGLYDNRNRFLSPSLGRFNKEDPLGFVDGLNLYQDVKGNPVKYIDPSGLKIPDEDRPSGSGIGVGGAPSKPKPDAGPDPVEQERQNARGILEFYNESAPGWSWNYQCDQQAKWGKRKLQGHKFMIYYTMRNVGGRTAGGQ